jgi:hypothetical protein
MTDLPYDILNADQYVQERYRQMVLDGTSPRLAETLALQKFPGTVSDREFFKGQKPLADEWQDDATLRKNVKLARLRGGNPGPNDVYVPSLADGAGDPLAFVPATGGRGHVKKVLQMRNWSADGLVKNERDLSRSAPQKKALSNLAMRNLKYRYRSTEEHARTPERALEEMIVAKHAKKK